ncbi:MAG: 4-hydroxy-tetrahydrodipicolinate reductase [Pontiellaceae bacterium]|jgi:4-hydroxy-tetrahydrodipicolinate reductase|nr:4-hydroxy-tetrahydrodipicolinate reductase [Pontiellaceae bacterium]
MSINVVIQGAAGRMGKTLIRCIQEGKVAGLKLTGAVDLWDVPDIGKDAGLAAGTKEAGIKMTADLAAVASAADVIVDFTSHIGTSGNAERIANWKTAWVIGTTGLSDTELAEVKKTAQSVPVVMAGNMSLGINLLCNLVQEAAEALYARGYDIEVIERHHNQKKDAPSGTALMLGQAAADGAGLDLKKSQMDGRTGMPGARTKAEIGFHAIRGGDIIGDHTVLMAGPGEMIELSHRVTSRETLAIGALNAAAWVVQQPPCLYSMKDVLGL